MKRVLVVDDMAVFREPIAAALRMAEFEVAVASDGADALGKVETFKPDIVLLDLAMPGVDGITALRHLRESDQHHALPVIVLTAVTERDYIQRAAQLGVSGYLLKSQFSLTTLIDRIRDLLAGNADQATPPDIEDAA